MKSTRITSAMSFLDSLHSAGVLMAVLVGCCVCALPARASVIGTATLVKDPSAGLPFASPDSALGGPWVSYKLGIQATAGELIQAVDVSITGQLHQRWSSTNSDGMYDTPTANSANAANGDSHFMATHTMLFASGPTEDNPATFAPLGGGSPLSPTNTVDTGYGVGTSMSAVFGIPGPAATSMNLAYIVIPKGSESSLNIDVKVADPNGDIVSVLSVCNFLACGGEPAVVTPLELFSYFPGTTVSGTVTATNNPTSWGPALNSLVLQSYTPNYGAPAGAPGLSIQPTWDPATQQFSWNTQGSTRGDYVWGVSATNAGGTGNGLITAHLALLDPEPSSFVLAALGMVGTVGFTRCRSVSRRLRVYCNGD